MTLGAFTGYFRQRESNKNTLYPYSRYSGHFVLGVIYSKCNDAADERKQFSLEDLPKIPSVIKEFQFFAQPKYQIASARPGSGNTKNIGSVTKIDDLVNGTGTFATLGTNAKRARTNDGRAKLSCPNCSAQRFRCGQLIE